MALPHDDGEIVVNLPDVFSGISPERLQVVADLDAFHAFALEATFGLLCGFFSGIAPYRVCRGHLRQRIAAYHTGEKTSFVCTLVFSEAASETFFT